ncbi:hypothetical protein ENSA7_69390 [Enhygromyxa salina]|uniref:Uncharacterized protein n=1 Tax=Enhygromyxa salina TaxID=215803 RepID=A0A2S9XTE4_9BACT|nr:hypothetical protein ENSA7_69390 [Enhygromyxa salina]
MTTTTLPLHRRLLTFATWAAVGAAVGAAD